MNRLSRPSVPFRPSASALLLVLLPLAAPPGAGAAGSVEEAVREYQKSGKAPVLQESDAVVWPFGESQPVLRCTPLRACDVELEAGEVVHGVALGDTEQWITSPLFSGDPAALVPHVVVKPRDFGIATNLIVTTTRRTYYLALVSPPEAEAANAGSYFRRVRFYYPGDLVQQWSDAARLEATRKDRETSQTVASLSGALDPKTLHFDYALAGKRGVPFRPVSVFDDGHHTYIQLPDRVRAGDAPAFLAKTAGGEDVILNYRMNGSWIVVDGLFAEAELALGVGRSRQAVRITNRALAPASEVP